MCMWKLPQTLAHKVVQFSSCPILLEREQPKQRKRGRGEENRGIVKGVAISMKVVHGQVKLPD